MKPAMRPLTLTMEDTVKAKMKIRQSTVQPQAPPAACAFLDRLNVPSIKRLSPFIGIGEKPSLFDCQTTHEEATRSAHDLASLLIDVHAGLKEVGIPYELTLAALGDAIQLQVEVSRLAFNWMSELSRQPAQPEVHSRKAA